MNKLLFAYILFLACIICLFSCKTTEQSFNAGYKKNPVKMAELTRKIFPCIVTANDTIKQIDTLYDLVEVKCPDSIAYRVDSFETSYAVRVPVYIKTQVPRVRETVTHTIRIEDSAKIFFLLNNLEVKDGVIEDQQQSIIQQGKKITKKNKRLTWLYIIIAGLILWTVRKPLLRIIKPI